MSSIVNPGSAPAGPRGGIRSPLTFDDLTADLIWPRLLKAGRLALRPAHLGLAFFLVVGCEFIVWLLIMLENGLGLGDESAREYLRWTIAALDPGTIRQGPLAGGTGPDWLMNAFLDFPQALVVAHPLASTIGGIAVLLVWSVLGGAICRSTAVEFALAKSQPWPQSLASGIRHAGSTAVSLLTPLLVVWAIGFFLAVGGLVLLRLPVVNVLGGLLYGLFLLSGFIAVLLMLGYAAGHWMLVPAVACERTDAIDGMQRTFAYVRGRPLKLAAYLGTLVAQGWILAWIVWAAMGAVVSFTQRCSSVWAGESGRAMLEAAAAGPLAVPGAPGAGGFSGALVKSWNFVPFTIGSAFVFSFVFCGSTLLYLAMRRVNDSQDMNEIAVDRALPMASQPIPDGVGDAG